jgi:hypothetical protein
MAELNIPVLVGVVPLFCVTNFVVEEGYKTVSIAGSRFTQLVTPTQKTITIEALLVREWRLVRPVLEGLALVTRGLASAAAPLMVLAGIPVISKTSVHLDMQITALTFTQKPDPRDTLTVSIKLAHVPRSASSTAFGLGADVAAAVGGPFIP